MTFVKWGQGACSAPSGETGNCVPSNECQGRGGIAAGQCAGGEMIIKLNCTQNLMISLTGYGICCVFMGKFFQVFYASSYNFFLNYSASCGGVARENGTYFVNPNHPETTDGTGSCQLTVLKMHPEICQIRLDFEQFALAGMMKMNFQKL